jgi:hypothetical protein
MGHRQAEQAVAGVFEQRQDQVARSSYVDGGIGRDRVDELALTDEFRVVAQHLANPGDGDPVLDGDVDAVLLDHDVDRAAAVPPRAWNRGVDDHLGPGGGGQADDECEQGGEQPDRHVGPSWVGDA